MAVFCDDRKSLSVWKKRIEIARQQIMRVEDNSANEQWIESLISLEYQEAIQNLEYHSVQTDSSQEQILFVRTILRFLMVTLGVPSEQHRNMLQIALCRQPILLDSLGHVIVHLKQDTKSRVSACRLLANLVTTNSTTSRIALDHWDWQPSDEDRMERVTDSVVGRSKNIGDTSRGPHQPVWLDFLLAATDRSALAALVACWYNALQAVEIPPVQDMTDAALFISNLLRQLLPSSAVLSPQRESKKPDESGDVGGGDEATKWITLLVCFLCRSGSLSKLYQAATGISIDSQTLDHSILSHVLPEQVLLLQALLSQMDEESETREANITPLGDHQDALQSNMLFLARDLYLSIRQNLFSSREGFDNEKKHSSRQEMTESLGPTTLSLIRELLSDLLADQSAQSKELRYILGKEEHIVAAWIQDLGYYYDKVQARFRGRPAKEIVLTQEEQRIFVSLVRLIGNLCHQSRINQNHLRETAVPQSDQKDNDNALLRTGLHLLLSCTSLSHTCFTLREWSVVAIRNALDENVENQALVAELQAQEPAPSSPLEEMGVRVQLEKGGKVSLKPIEENK